MPSRFVDRVYRTKPISFQKAIEKSICNQAPADGAMEHLGSIAEQTAYRFSVLAGILHDKGIISDAEASELVGWRYQLEKKTDD